jgi:hypothetical protein
MRREYIAHSLTVLVVLFGILLFKPDTALAHCDTMDGPVVKAAQRALATRNVNLVLIWVQEKSEVEVRQRFRQTLAVRRLNHEARELADNYFFETVVRLHRVGEEEPYTGLRPAGTDLGPVIPVADKALQSGSLEPLLNLFPTPARSDIRTRFEDAISKRGFDKNDVEAGRKYVKAYVSFMHYLEHLFEERTEGATKHGTTLH